MYNQYGFNTTFTGSLTGNTVSDTLNNMNSYKQDVKNKYDTIANNELEEQFRKLTECSFATTDEKTKSMNNCGANLAQMELIIKQAAEANGSDAYKNLGTGQILPRYVGKNPKRASLSEAALRGNFPVESWARQIGALKGTVMPSTQQEGEIKYNSGANKKGKSVVGTVVKYGWPIPVGEVGGYGLEKFGQYLQNRTLDKYTDSDANSLSRYYDYQMSTKNLNDKLLKAGEELAEKEELLREYESGKPLLDVPEANTDGLKKEIELLKEKINGYKEELAHIDENSKYYPEGKPQTVRETLDEFDVGRGIKGAGEALSDARIYYTEELRPYLKLSKTEWNVPKILESITADDVGLSKGMWEDAKAIINKEIMGYANDTNASLERLHEIMQDFNLSNQKIQGQDTEGVRKAVNDAIHTKLRNLVNQTLDAENPGFNANTKTTKYSKLLEGAKELKGKAVEAGKNSGQTSFKQDLMKLLRSPQGQKWIGRGIQKGGNKIRISTYIRRLINKIKGNEKAVVEKGKEIANKTIDELKANAGNVENAVKETAKKGVKKVKNVNPKAYIQKGMFSSPMDFAGIYISDMLDKQGYEMPIEVITEIASYALETNKLNKEMGTDLPLYDKENSYLNQNPNANMSKEDRLKVYRDMLPDAESYPDWFQERVGLYDTDDASVKELESQPWFQEILKSEEGNKYNELSKEDIEKLLDSLE